MSDCLFCKIAAEEIPSKKVYADDDVFAFHDISPQAPTHVLVIPRQHLATLDDTDDSNTALLGKMTRVAVKIAGDRGLKGDGYRLVMNCGEKAGQSVFHIHLHLLGGRAMNWPPG